MRSWRARFKKGELTQAEYDKLLEKEIEESIRFQEDTQIDVLVHGEFERNDMVEYFGELLKDTPLLSLAGTKLRFALRKTTDYLW